MKRYVGLMTLASLVLTVQVARAGFFGEDLSDYTRYVPFAQGESLIVFSMQGKPWITLADEIEMKQLVLGAIALPGLPADKGGELDAMKREFARMYDSARAVGMDFFRETAVFVHTGKKEQLNPYDAFARYIVVVRVNMKWKPTGDDAVMKQAAELFKTIQNIPETSPVPLLGSFAVRFGDFIVLGDNQSIADYLARRKEKRTNDDPAVKRVNAAIGPAAFFHWSTKNPHGLTPMMEGMMKNNTRRAQQYHEMRKLHLDLMNKFAEPGATYTIEDVDHIQKCINHVEERVDISGGLRVTVVVRGSINRYVPLLRRMATSPDYLRLVMGPLNASLGTDLTPEEVEYSADVDSDYTDFTMTGRMGIKREVVKRLMARQAQNAIAAFVMGHSQSSRMLVRPKKPDGAAHDNKSAETNRTPADPGAGFIESGWVDGDNYRVLAAGSPKAGLTNAVQRRLSARSNALAAAQKKALHEFRVMRFRNPALQARASEAVIAKEFGGLARAGVIVRERYQDDGGCDLVLQVSAPGLRRKVTEGK